MKNGTKITKLQAQRGGGEVANPPLWPHLDISMQMQMVNFFISEALPCTAPNIDFQTFFFFSNLHFK